MNSKPSFIDRHAAFLCALMLNTLVLLICLFFCPMQFGTNDDRDISNILANVYGAQDSYHIVFVNVIFCRILSFIYEITNNLTNWYVLICVVFSFISMVALTHMLLCRTKHFGIGFLLSVILVLRLYESHYVIFQFTQNAALYTMAGVFLLIDTYLHWDHTPWFRSILGAVLLILGSLIRFQAIYFTLPYLAMYLACHLLFSEKKQKVIPAIIHRKHNLLIIFVCILLVFCARFYHNYAFRSDPVLQQYQNENLLRAELMDYGLPSYDENAATLEALGISEEDLSLFAAQFYLDKSVYSETVLEALCQMKENQAASYSVSNLSLSSIPAAFRYILNDMTGSPYWWIILSLCLFFIITTDRKGWILLLGSLGFTFAVLWYFVSVNRIPYRVWYSITTPLLLSLLYLCADNPALTLTRFHLASVCSVFSEEHCFIRVMRKLSTVGLAILSIILVALAGRQMYLYSQTTVTDDYAQIIEFAESHPEDLVLLDRPTVSRLTYTSTVTPFTIFRTGSHRNIMYTGGWICWTPANLSTMSRFDVNQNVFEAIGLGESVYLIDGDTPELKLDFINRHYNPDVTMEFLGYIDGTEIGIYHFATP